MSWSRYWLVLGLALAIGHLAFAEPPVNSQGSPAPAQTTELSASDIYKQALPSVVYIDVQAKDGKEYSGSGFVALKDGDVVTCWHVVHDAKSVAVRFSDGEEFEATGLVDHDVTNDLALIKVRAVGKPLLTMSKDDPAIGATIYTIGSPLGVLDFTISNGIISQIRKGEDSNFYQFTAAVSPGNSGGPVLDDTGRVIGLVDLQMVEGQNLNFAVPAKYALGLDPTLPTKPWSDVVDDTPAGASSDDTSNDDFDKQAAISLADIEDALISITYETTALHNVNNFYKSGVSPALYTLQEDLKNDQATLAPMSPSDPNRQTILPVLSGALQHFADAIGFLSQAILAAQANGGWSPTANDLVSRAIAAVDSAPPLSPDDEKLLYTSRAFATAEPEIVKVYQDKDPFPWGIMTMFRSPLFVCLVTKGEVADHLGVLPGDQIISIDGQVPTDLLNIRDLVEKDIGKQVDIKVQRRGKVIDLKGNVPALPAPAPPSP